MDILRHIHFLSSSNDSSVKKIIGWPHKNVKNSCVCFGDFNGFLDPLFIVSFLLQYFAVNMFNSNLCAHLSEFFRQILVRNITPALHEVISFKEKQNIT